MAERELLDEKRDIEAMTTAILSDDALAQSVIALRLQPGGEPYVRAAAGIIAGIFTALGRQVKVAPSEVWRMHMAGTTRSRGTDA